jgi:hypothetical protein
MLVRILALLITFSVSCIGVVKINDLLALVTVGYFVLNTEFSIGKNALFMCSFLVAYLSFVFAINFSNLHEIISYVNAIFVLFCFAVFTGFEIDASERFLIAYIHGVLMVIFISFFERSFLSLGLGTQYSSSSGSAIQGFMLDPNRFGFTLNIALAVLLELRTRIKLVPIIAIILLVALYYTNSRAALAVGVLNVLIFFLGKKNNSRFIVLVTVILTFFNLDELLSLHPKFLAKSISFSDDARYIYMETVLSEKFQFIGQGFNAVWRDFNFTSHNTFLEFYYDFGLIGLTCYVLILLFVFLKVYETSKTFSFNLLLILLGYSFIMNLTFNLVFFSLIGFILSYVRGKRSNSSIPRCV